MIRAVTSASDIRSRIARLYPLEVLKIKQLEGYDDLNFYLECRSEDDGAVYKYICKVVNNQDSQKPEIVEAQNRLMEYLSETKHLIRLLTYLDGTKLNDCPPRAELYINAGDFTGRIYSSLKEAILADSTGTQDLNEVVSCRGYKDDDMIMRKSPWMLASVPELHKFLVSVQNPQHRELARTTVLDFEIKVLPVIPELEKGVMHGDINEHNILVRDTSIVGLIDFGDSCWGPVVFEIALCVAYMCLHSNDISTGKHVLEGYQIHRPLTTVESKIIKSCVCARLAQSLVLGCHSALGDQGNAYILSSQKNGWSILTQLSAIEDTHITALWGLEL